MDNKQQEIEDSVNNNNYMEYRTTSDPTVLTTQQLMRVVSGLKEVIFTRLDAMDRAMSLFNDNITRVPTDTDKQISHLRSLQDERINSSEEMAKAHGEILKTRLNGMDKAVALLQEFFNSMPAKTDERIGALKDVHEEKFVSIQVQFKERDVRTEQSSKDSKVAVDAALQAAKEAVGEQNKSSALAIAKSETSTTKQIDQLGQLIQTSNKAVDDKFNDLKERITRLEGKGEGKVVADSSHHVTSTFVVSVVSVFIAFIAVSFAIGAALLKH